MKIKSFILTAVLLCFIGLTICSASTYDDVAGKTFYYDRNGTTVEYTFLTTDPVNQSGVVLASWFEWLDRERGISAFMHDSYDFTVTGETIWVEGVQLVITTSGSLFTICPDYIKFEQ